MFHSKKGAGLVNGLVLGIAALVIGAIIAFVIVQSVEVIDNDFAAAIPIVVTNESSWINSTGYTLTKSTEVGFASPVILEAWNLTDNSSITTANVSVSSSGNVTNASSYQWSNTAITYQYTYTPTEATADRMISNFSAGIDNVSSKLPTVLLIAAIVLILGILVLLYQQYRKMSFGGGEI